MWRRTARRTLLLAWLLFLAVVAFLVTHPRLVAPLAARLVSRNLFRDREGTVRVRDFRGNPFKGLELYQVSLSLADGSGGAIAATVDTLVLDYRWEELLADSPRLRRVEARGAMVHATTSGSRGQRRPPGGGPSAGSAAVVRRRLPAGRRAGGLRRGRSSARAPARRAPAGRIRGGRWRAAGSALRARRLGDARKPDRQPAPRRAPGGWRPHRGRRPPAAQRQFRGWVRRPAARRRARNRRARAGHHA